MAEENTIREHLALLPIVSLNSGAQGATGGTEITGITLDLQGTTARRYRRARVSVPMRIVLGTGEQLVVSGNLQDSTATGAGWTDFGTAPSNVTFNTSGTNDDRFAWEQDLTTAERYLRVQFTPDFQTDTGGNTTATGHLVSYMGIANLTDANRLPASG